MWLLEVWDPELTVGLQEVQRRPGSSTLLASGHDRLTLAHLPSRQPQPCLHSSLQQGSCPPFLDNAPVAGGLAQTGMRPKMRPSRGARSPRLSTADDLAMAVSPCSRHAARPSCPSLRSLKCNAASRTSLLWTCALLGACPGRRRCLPRMDSDSRDSCQRPKRGRQF
jgi:hypothetical protein